MINLSRNEFERLYTKYSHTNMAALHGHGRYAKRCQCGDETCQGWQMARVADFDEYTEHDGWVPAIFKPGECEARCDDECELGPVHCRWAHEPDHKPGWHSAQDCPVFGPAD